MKTRKKLILTVLIIVVFLTISGISCYIFHENKIKKYSTYCMDEVRNQLGEYVGNISNYYVDKTYGGFLVYSGNVSYEGADYTYNCKVLNKDKVELELQEVSGNISGKIEVSKEVKSLDSNVIYGGKGKHEISGDETIYYNSGYGISLKVGKDFRGGVILESDTDQWDTSTDNRYTTHDINFLKLEDYKLGTYQPGFLITVFSNEETEKRKTASTWNKGREDSIIGMNNKYTFIGLPSSGDFYSDLYFFDVEESKSVVNIKEEKNDFQIPTFEELEDIVAMCPYETMGGGYDEYPVYKREFILPYGDGYVGYNYGGNNGEGWGYYLTYKSLDNPCEVISSSDEFFFRYFNDRTHYINPQDPIRPDNKVFRGLGGIALGIVEKELNCEMGNDINDDDTCQKEMNKYMYNLVIGKEKNDYFIKWINFLKKSIDTKNYVTLYDWGNIEMTCYETNPWLDLLKEYGEDNKNLTEEKRKEYNNIHHKRIRECVDSFIK